MEIKEVKNFFPIEIRSAELMGLDATIMAKVFAEFDGLRISISALLAKHIVAELSQGTVSIVIQNIPPNYNN